MITTRLKFFLPLVAIGLVGFGSVRAYRVLTNLKPKTYSIEEYNAKRPADQWLVLTGGEMQLKDVSYLSFLGVGSASKVYLPLRPIGAKESDPVVVLVSSKDPNLLSVTEVLRNARTDEDIARFKQTHTDVWDMRRDVKGYIRGGDDLKESEVAKLRKVNPDLADDFIILDEGASPDFGDVFMFVVGLVLCTGLFFYYRAKLRGLKSSTTTPPGSPPFPGGPSAPPQIPK